MQIQIGKGIWLSLSREIRAEVVKICGLSMDESRHTVSNGTILSDGYSNKMLALITKEKMESYIGEKIESFFVCWESFIKKVEESLKVAEQPKQSNVQKEHSSETSSVKSPKRGRLKKDAK